MPNSIWYHVDYFNAIDRGLLHPAGAFPARRCAPGRTPRSSDGLGRQFNLVFGHDVGGLNTSGTVVHAVRIVADERRPFCTLRSAAEVFRMRPVVVCEKLLGKTDRARRHVVGMVWKRLPDDGDSKRTVLTDELAAKHVAGGVGVAAGDKPCYSPHSGGRLVEHSAGMAYVGATDVWTPCRKARLSKGASRGSWKAVTSCVRAGHCMRGGAIGRT